LVFNKNTFLKKYNNFINIIPEESNTIFLEYPEIKDNGYKYYVNFIIFLHIIVYENIDNINKERLVNDDIENINKQKIKKIESMFKKEDIDIVDKYAELIITILE
jgi:hypothetical protein